MVKLVFGGLICCGVANGLVFSCVESSDKYAWMLVIMFLCCALLLWHWRSTKQWCDDKKRDDHVDYDEDHARVFINSFIVTFILLVIACLVGYMGLIVAIATMMVAFAVAAIREGMYSY